MYLKDNSYKFSQLIMEYNLLIYNIIKLEIYDFPLNLEILICNSPGYNIFKLSN